MPGITVTISVEGFEDEITEWAAAEKSSPENLITRIVLDRLRVFLLGKISGSAAHHKQTMEMIAKIGAGS